MNQISNQYLKLFQSNRAHKTDRQTEFFLLNLDFSYLFEKKIKIYEYYTSTPPRECGTNYRLSPEDKKYRHNKKHINLYTTCFTSTSTWWIGITVSVKKFKIFCSDRFRMSWNYPSQWRFLLRNSQKQVEFRWIFFELFLIIHNLKSEIFRRAESIIYIV